MQFFTFKQNNSGGSFDHDADAGIGYAVIVEADDAQDASRRAKAIGLYFNGCDDGRDCQCCGDRWYPESEGTDEPELYGEVLRPAEAGRQPRIERRIPLYIHYADGTIKAVAA